jgi:Uma2 family endonuclease
VLDCQVMKRAAATSVPQPPMTLEEWAELDEDEEGELVDGLLEEEEMPTFLHELVVAWFIHTLRTWARSRRGFVTGSETKVAIGPGRGRKPDVSVFLGRRPALLDSLVRVIPHAMVEVLSPRPRDARRDRVDKVRDYAAARARYYWIVDPQVRMLEVLELGAKGRYSQALVAKDGKVRGIPGCPGLTIDLDALWAEIDEADTDTPAPRKVRKPRALRRTPRKT